MSYLLPADDALLSGEAVFARRLTNSAAVGTGNGNLRLSYFTAHKTESIGTVRTVSGGTAAVGTTLARIGIYEEASNGDLTLVGATANDTNLWIAQNTVYTKSLSASFTKKLGTRYAVGTLVVGTSTAPTLCGLAYLVAAELAETPRLAGILLSQTDLPSSITAGSLGGTANQAYAALAA